MTPRILLAASALALLAAPHAQAAAPDVQAARSRASAAREDERRLAQAQSAALARLRGAEAATDAAIARIQDLGARRQAQADRLARRANDLAPLLPLLLHLARTPGPILLATALRPDPATPEQAQRGAALLASLAARIEQDAGAARGEQAELDALQTQIDTELTQLAAAQVAQANAATSLDQQLAATRQTRRVAEQEAEAAAREAAAEAARAETLRAAIARLEAEHRAAEQRAKAEAEQAAHDTREAAVLAARDRQAALAKPAGPGLDAARPAGNVGKTASARLTAPVTGQLVRHFGDPTDAGAATGIAYQAAPAARVVAPCAGRVVYAGPFRSYGKLLILDCGRGYHVVLSGFERLDAQVGQALGAGAPVGVMPGWDPRATAIRPALSVELRHAGEPINPLPFLG